MSLRNVKNNLMAHNLVPGLSIRLLDDDTLFSLGIKENLIQLTTRDGKRITNKDVLLIISVEHLGTCAELGPRYHVTFLIKNEVRQRSMSNWYLRENFLLVNEIESSDAK